jgi:hypothetical protein
LTFSLAACVPNVARSWVICRRTLCAIGMAADRESGDRHRGTFAHGAPVIGAEQG